MTKKKLLSERKPQYNFIDLTGKRFGRWTVISRSENAKHSSPMWLCKCDCGKEKIVHGGSLRGGKSLSCGCLMVERSVAAHHLLKGEKNWRYMKNREVVVHKRIIDSYKYKAKERGLDWKLTDEHAQQIMNSNCCYCGQPPSNFHRQRGEKVFYNGIDRINNTVGYVITNVVPCCYVCNRAKSTMSKNEFTAWIKRAYEHTVSGHQGIYFVNTVNGEEKVTMPIPVSFYESLFGKFPN